MRDYLRLLRLPKPPDHHRLRVVAMSDLSDALRKIALREVVQHEQRRERGVERIVDPFDRGLGLRYLAYTECWQIAQPKPGDSAGSLDVAERTAPKSPELKPDQAIDEHDAAPADGAWLSQTDLARIGRVNPNTLRTRLRPWRRSHGNNEWQRAQNPRPRDPHFTYRWGAVKSLIAELPKTGQSPAKKKKPG
jgi:hypothetical protein